MNRICTFFPPCRGTIACDASGLSNIDVRPCSCDTGHSHSRHNGFLPRLLMDRIHTSFPLHSFSLSRKPEHASLTLSASCVARYISGTNWRYRYYRTSWLHIQTSRTRKSLQSGSWAALSDHCKWKASGVAENTLAQR